jgi:hypothetical protein
MKTKTLRLLPLLAALILAAMTVAPCAFAREIVLQDDQLRVSFDSHSGALTGLEDKTTHWVIERRPEQAMSLRLFAPLPERRWNPVIVPDKSAGLPGEGGQGKKQPAAEVKKISDHELHLQWKNLVSDSDGVLPMTLNAVVTLTNGTLTFAATLDNASPLTVETIDYPYLGDLSAPPRDSKLEMRVMRNNRPGNLRTDEIYPHFHNEHGYWGVFWPLKTREAQESRCCVISAPNHGIYVGVDVRSVPYRLQYTFEQHPGVVSAINDLVPQEDKIAGTPVHLEFRTCHFVFAQPHSSVTLAPIVLRCYQGDWHAGVALSKQSK